MNRTQHPSNNAVLIAPEGMSIEECSALPVTRIQYADGSYTVASYWTPTSEELALIASGKSIRLIVLGSVLPPVILGVDGDSV